MQFLVPSQNLAQIPARLLGHCRVGKLMRMLLATAMLTSCSRRLELKAPSASTCTQASPEAGQVLLVGSKQDTGEHHGAIEGVVIHDGTPVAGVTVVLLQLVNDFEPETKSVVTEADGFFRLEAPSPAEYHLEVLSSDYYPGELHRFSLTPRKALSVLACMKQRQSPT